MNPLDCPRCDAQPDPCEQYTASQLVGFGLRITWQDFLNGIRRSWREAHRNTYDVCPHPPSMRDDSEPELWIAYRERCRMCGRTRDRHDNREFAEWLTDEERLKALTL